MPGLPLALLVMMQSAAADPSTLAGSWSVDLSVDPAEPYTQPMALVLAADGTASGSFYQSDILAGRWRNQNDRLCVIFRTTDGGGPYHTSACLEGDRVVGQTWAEHRDFIFLWTATRAVE